VHVIPAFHRDKFVFSWRQSDSFVRTSNVVDIKDSLMKCDFQSKILNT